MTTPTGHIGDGKIDASEIHAIIAGASSILLAVKRLVGSAGLSKQEIDDVFDRIDDLGKEAQAMVEGRDTDSG